MTVLKTMACFAALFAALATATPTHAAYDQSLTRSLDAGQVHGKVDASYTHAFLGIPFPQPPVLSLIHI